MSRRRIVDLVLGVWMVCVLWVTVFGMVLKVPLVWGSGTIYIEADGSIDPPDAPIDTADMVTYYLTDNINFTTWSCIVIEKDDIVLDGAGYTIRGPGSGYGVELWWTSNVTIQGMGITNFTYGILFTRASNSRISGCNITENHTGIQVDTSSNNNTITGNRITKNSAYGGIELYTTSNNTVVGNSIAENGYGIHFWKTSKSRISGNNITNNEANGIEMHNSSDNILHGNNIAENYNGLVLSGSASGGSGCSNNKFYHNNIMNNTPGDNIACIYQLGYTNFYDDGYPSGGNYWSDYTGVDLYSGPDQNGPGSDGIGDAPYAIPDDNQDRYPLMNPWTDITPPETTISLSGAVGDNDWFTSDVTVTLSAIDDGEVAKTEYSFDNVAWNTYTTSFVLTDEGTTTVYYKSTDKAGNPEATKTRTIRIDATNPTANAGVDQTVNEGAVVTFDGSASTDTNGIATYTWTFTDVTPQTLSGQTPTYTFATPGTYTTTLEVADPAGNTATDTVNINVLDTTTPVANAGQDQTTDVDATVSFDAGASSDNVGIVSYEWDFGDGTTAAGKTTTHTYTSPGTYTVTLTVEDAAGNTDTHSLVVTVLSAEAFPLWIVGAAIAAIAIAVAAVLLLRRRK